MAGWRINEVELRVKIAEIWGVSLEEVDRKVPVFLAQRIARESGDQFTITPTELAKVTRQAALKPRHFLNFADRDTVAVTLEAIEELINPVKEKDSILTARARVDSLDEGNLAWSDFLNTFLDPVSREKPWWDYTKRKAAFAKEVSLDLMAEGARFFLENPNISPIGRKAYDALIHGAVTLVAPGDTVDIRIRSLLDGAIKVARSMSGPTRSREEKIIGLYQQKGMVAPPTKDQALAITEDLESLLEDSKNDRELLDALKRKPEKRDDFESLLRFIANFKKGETGRLASEALIALQTDMYERRASAPFGVLPEDSPVHRLNTNSKWEVLRFLRDTLGIPLDLDNELQAKAIWHVFRTTWKELETATDLDKTFYFDTLLDLEKGIPRNFINGVETVRLNGIIIRHIAWVLYNKRPMPIASHTIKARLADNANHPLLKAYKFIASLRIGGPDITIEEIASQSTISTYEEFAYGSVKRLLELARRGMGLWADPADQRDKDTRQIVSAAMQLKDVERGPKHPAVMIEQGKAGAANAKLFYDDKDLQGKMYQAHRQGISVIVPSNNPLKLEKKMRKASDRMLAEKANRINAVQQTIRGILEKVRKQNVPLVVFADELAAAQKALQALLESEHASESPVVVDARTAQTLLADVGFPVIEAKVVHEDWGRKVYHYFFKPGAALIISKLWALQQLVARGEWDQFRRAADLVLKELDRQVLTLDKVVDSMAKALIPEATVEDTQPPPRQSLPRAVTPVYFKTIHTGVLPTAADPAPTVLGAPSLISGAKALHGDSIQGVSAMDPRVPVQLIYRAVGNTLIEETVLRARELHAMPKSQQQKTGAIDNSAPFARRSFHSRSRLAVGSHSVRSARTVHPFGTRGGGLRLGR